MNAQKKKNYRATFILNTRGYEEPVETLVEKLKGEVTAIGCEITQTQSLGRKDFIRVTDKTHTGDTYVQIDFAGPKGCAPALREKLRLEPTVKRILVENIK